jgi:DNA-binding response OmpR family regulator
MKVLIIEDEAALADSMAAFLTAEDMVVEVAHSFNEAATKAGVYSYDCVLVDILLPGGTGLDVLRQLKRDSPQTGVIIVSARDSLDDKLKGLGLGADDYITKPFHLAELNARIHALMRRRQRGGTRELVAGPIRINTDSHEAHVGDCRMDLTRKEYDLLVYLASNVGRVLTKEAIVEHLWGDMALEGDTFDFVYTHVKNLRKKLAAGTDQDLIKTIYGMGYKLKV